MADPTLIVGLGAAAFTAFTAVAAAGLRAWEGWLEVKRLAVSGRSDPRPASGGDLDEIRRRIRELEAIANGTRG